MKNLVILALALGLSSCQAQDKKTDTISQNQKENQHKPNEKWTVNKEVDENGNVIRYDSIYSWSSSGNAQMMTSRDMDSIMKSFTNQFQQGMPSGNDSFFEQFFNGNTMGSDDFFSSFFAQDSLQNSNINSIRQQMQAMQQQLMQNMRQPLIPAAPEETKPEKESDN